MLTLVRCGSGNEDFIELIDRLDQALNERNGEAQKAYDRFNRPGHIETVVIAYEDGRAAGCGCFKSYDPQTAEIKRMFVQPEYRGRGIARKILRELEKWAGELGFTASILETGTRQTEAIGLYLGCGYRQIENYGQYAAMCDSVCFAKELNKG